MLVLLEAIISLLKVTFNLSSKTQFFKGWCHQGRDGAKLPGLSHNFPKTLFLLEVKKGSDHSEWIAKEVNAYPYDLPMQADFCGMVFLKLSFLCFLVLFKFLFSIFRFGSLLSRGGLIISVWSSWSFQYHLPISDPATTTASQVFSFLKVSHGGFVRNVVNVVQSKGLEMNKWSRLMGVCMQQ